jgi:hypothetical protein
MLRLNKSEELVSLGFWSDSPGKYNNCSTFKLKLKQEEFSFWKCALGDDGYRGLGEFITLCNKFDSPELDAFKEHAMACHESFNQRIQKWQVLTKTIWHGVTSYHKTAFWPVCAISTLYMKVGMAALAYLILFLE